MLQASGACSSLPGAQAHRLKAPGRRASLRLRLISVSGSAQDRGTGTSSGSGTTKVKFVLQKQCMFGEHFKVIGAHSALGEWDPDAAVPLEWSEGHNWTAELEVPQGGEYEYKFVLKSKNGAIHWQPGPNRVFSTLRKPSSLVVAQDWDSDQTCVVMEEEQEHVSSSEENELPGSAMAEDLDGETYNQERDYVSTEQNGQVRECESTEEPAVLVLDKQELQTTEERQESGSAAKSDNEEAGEDSSQYKQELQNEQTVDSQQIPDQDVLRQDEQHHSFCQNEDSQQQSIQDEADVDHPENVIQDSTGSAFDGAPNQIREHETSGTNDKAQFNGNTEPSEPASLILWRKDRDWFAKVVTAIASFFKR